jgi:hypothetical protein
LVAVAVGLVALTTRLTALAAVASLAAGTVGLVAVAAGAGFDAVAGLIRDVAAETDREAVSDCLPEVIVADGVAVAVMVGVHSAATCDMVLAEAVLVVPACWSMITPLMARNPATLATVAPCFQMRRRLRVSALACCAALGAFWPLAFGALAREVGSGVDMASILSVLTRGTGKVMAGYIGTGFPARRWAVACLIGRCDGSYSTPARPCFQPKSAA